MSQSDSAQQAAAPKGAGSAAAVATGGNDFERGLVRDSISNVNQTLQYQVSFGMALIGLCITALKVFPPRYHPHLVFELICTVSIPVLLGMALAFWAQDDRWFYKKKVVLEDADEETLHSLARAKIRLLNLAVTFHALAIVLFSAIIMIEYK